jgi:tungstate transport system substrate-binding protein
MFEDKFGVDLDIITGGTGKALELGRMGDVDILTIHDQAREEEFVNEGYGLKRHPIAYNFFMIVGPETDPAGIKEVHAQEAFMRVMRKGQEDSSKVFFVSRGDNSGTHAKEKLIWQSGDKDYESVRNSGQWYLEGGAGMGAILTIADEKSAYTLTDIGTYMAFKRKLRLVPMVDEGELLMNMYSAIVVNPRNHPNNNEDMASNLIQFLTSQEIQKFIGSYGISEYGTALFTPANQGNIP